MLLTVNIFVPEKIQAEKKFRKNAVQRKFICAGQFLGSCEPGKLHDLVDQAGEYRLLFIRKTVDWQNRIRPCGT